MTPKIMATAPKDDRTDIRGYVPRLNMWKHIYYDTKRNIMTKVQYHPAYWLSLQEYSSFSYRDRFEFQKNMAYSHKFQVETNL